MEDGLVMQHAALVNDFHQGIADYLAQKESAGLRSVFAIREGWNTKRDDIFDGIDSE